MVRKKQKHPGVVWLVCTILAVLCIVGAGFFMAAQTQRDILRMEAEIVAAEYRMQGLALQLEEEEAGLKALQDEAGQAEGRVQALRRQEEENQAQLGEWTEKFGPLEGAAPPEDAEPAPAGSKGGAA